MEKKAGPFQRVDLSGLESTIECCYTFYGDPQTPLIAYFTISMCCHFTT